MPVQIFETLDWSFLEKSILHFIYANVTVICNMCNRPNDYFRYLPTLQSTTHFKEVITYPGHIQIRPEACTMKQDLWLAR